MKHFLWVIPILLLSFCAPKEIPQKGPVDLDSIAEGKSLLQSDVDMTTIASSAEPEPPPVEDEEENIPPAIVALNAQTMPVSEPHAGSPGGIIADTLRIFQCETPHTKEQDGFFLHVLNYRIHTLGAHPLCEVIQIANTKKVLAYANYQRDHCDNYTSRFIDELTQHQCTQIITLMPAGENEV